MPPKCRKIRESLSSRSQKPLIHMEVEGLHTVNIINKKAHSLASTKTNTLMNVIIGTIAYILTFYSRYLSQDIKALPSNILNSTANLFFIKIDLSFLKCILQILLVLQCKKYYSRDKCFFQPDLYESEFLH